MRTLTKLLALVTLAGAVGGCYVETHHPHTYTAYRTCNPGYHWDGYNCVRYIHY